MKASHRIAPRTLAIAASSAFILLAAGWSFAAISGITVTPGSACVGEGFTLTAVEDGTTPGIPSPSFYWEQRCVESGCAGDWVVLNGSTTQSITSASLQRGDREYRVTRSYSNGLSIIDSTKTTTVTWTPPSSIALTLGDQAPAANCSEIRLEFTTSCLAPGFSGLIQEKIWRGEDESEWTDTGPYFYFDLGKIVDIKQSCASPPAAWNNLPVGTFDTFDQQIRMTVRDCCNQSGQPIYFPKKRFVREKLANGEWQIRYVMDLE